MRPTRTRDEDKVTLYDNLFASKGARPKSRATDAMAFAGRQKRPWGTKERHQSRR
jgi:hypothetical protein